MFREPSPLSDPSTERSPLSCPRCEGERLDVQAIEAGLEVDFCPRCRGIFCDAGELDRVVGGPVERLGAISLPPLDARPLACPFCRVTPLRANEVRGADGLEVWDCRGCSGTWLDGGTVPRLRALARERRGSVVPVSPSGPSAPGPLGAPLGEADPLAYDLAALSEDAPPETSRLSFESDLSRRFAVPVAFLFAIVLTSGAFGRLLVTPFSIMIHELGHAIPAWLSGRAALPLPCGLTFWREEQSAFTALCLAFLLGVFGHRGLREGRPFPVVVAAVGWTLELVLYLGLSPDRSREIVVAGGMAGELAVSALLVVAFHFPLPDRLRWDFWRFFALVPAALTFVAAARLWWEVHRDARRLPTRSLFGGDGFSDVSRLVGEFDWSVADIARFYGGLAWACALIMVAVHGVFLWRSWRGVPGGR